MRRDCQNDGGSACRKPCIAKDIVHEKFTVAKNTVSAEDNINCLFGSVCWGSSAAHIADVELIENKTPCCK